MTVNDSSPPEPAPAAMVTSGAALGRAFLPEVAAFWSELVRIQTVSSPDRAVPTLLQVCPDGAFQGNYPFVWTRNVRFYFL